MDDFNGDFIMVINKIINNNKEVYQIIDGQGEYIINQPSEELAIAKYNAIKLAETQREYEELNPPYTVLRAKEYPDFREYLDAKVKQASTDDIVIMQGQLQEEKYLSDCLAVKAKYPKV
jgi:mRNA degradation ribonuclease J1/J2